MVVVMHPQARQEDIDNVVARVHESGLREQVIQGSELSVVAVIGDDRKKDRTVFETLPGVQKVVPILAPYKLASREVKKETTAVSLSKDCSIGGEEIMTIAGPCSVESRDQILSTAREVKAAGAKALRGGAFKPRTNPYSFQGLGEEGLAYLAEARRETGLPVVTEVLTPEDIELVAGYADCLQVGTRNAQNFKLLQACGEQNLPVLFKRGLANTLEEYLQAAEYILDAGNPNVILCERGIRTFETYTRNTLDLSAVLAAQSLSHLPVIVDPSHAAGRWRMVEKLSKAAVSVEADGIMVEVHHNPEEALSDGAQSLKLDTFDTMMESLRKLSDALGRPLK